MDSQFYLIVPLGLEHFALAELSEKWALLFPEAAPLSIREGKGGISFEGPLEQIVRLNHYLKIPTRLLLRIAEFKCRDFPKLYQKLTKIPWNLYLRGQIPELEFSSKASRIFDSRKVEKVIADALKLYYKAQPPKKKHLETLASIPTQKLYIRFEDDTCTVSMDTSGERLERRGYRTHIGEAPLRGSLAAGLLLALKQEIQIDCSLLDPMCGSGTFLLESALYYAATPRLDFSYLFFPCLAQLPPFKEIVLKGQGLFLKHIGKDIDCKVLEAALHNRTEAHLSEEQIHFSKEDLFSEEKSDLNSLAVICNPPYGERLNAGEIDKEFFDKMLKAIDQKYKPQIIGLLFPENFGTPQAPRGFQLHKAIRLSNGGIKVQFLIWKMPNGFKKNIL